MIASKPVIAPDFGSSGRCAGVIVASEAIYTTAIWSSIPAAHEV